MTSVEGGRFRFFAGKGGVGKTTTAAAFALVEARRGADVLIVSTDPAHSLGDALGLALGSRARAVPLRGGRASGGLRAVELDADRALSRWLKSRRDALRTIALRGTYLDEEDVDRFLALSLPGVDEVVGLVELWRLFRSLRPDLVVVDTAPSGHTLRLLETPGHLRQVAAVLDDMQAKHRLLADRLGGGLARDAAEALIDELGREGLALGEALRDESRVQVTWVALPEPLSIEEARDGVGALTKMGLQVDELVINQLTPRPQEPCRLCQARVSAESALLASLPAAFPRQRLRRLGRRGTEPRGASALASLGRELSTERAGQRWPPRGPSRARARAAPRRSPARAASPPWWLDRLAPEGMRLILFGGKGGVGKTSAAATVALAAARYTRRKVLLLSADPAHSVGDVLQLPIGDGEKPVRIPGARGALSARELDARRALLGERERYRRAVEQMVEALVGAAPIDPSLDRAVLEDLIDLAPPGMDELFAILTVTRLLVSEDRGAYDVVVMDTAPTGHALRLLALPESALEWVRALLRVLLKYREVTGLGALSESLLGLSRDLRALLELLREPARTAFVVVTRPAELPRRETVRLLDRLGKLQVPVSALIANAVTAFEAPACRSCRRSLAAERASLRALQSARRLTAPEAAMILASRVAPPPRGLTCLSAWGRSWTPWESRKDQ